MGMRAQLSVGNVESERFVRHTSEDVKEAVGYLSRLLEGSLEGDT